MKRNEIQLRWEGPMPAGTVIDQVITECLELLENGLKVPEDLWFHTVILSSDYEGPTVTVWGDPDYPGIFNCEFLLKTKWISLKDIKEARKND